MRSGLLIIHREVVVFDQLASAADQDVASISSIPDLLQRQFVAGRTNQLWVADISYVATWSGFAYVAFVRRFRPAKYWLACRVVRSMRTDLALDALEQALWSRREAEGVIHILMN
jgi:transposase InsO family protein